MQKIDAADSIGRSNSVTTTVPAAVLTPHAQIGALPALHVARHARVLMIQTQAENAGAQEVSRQLSEALAQRGHDVHQLFLFRRTDGFDQEPNTVFCAQSRPRGVAGLVRLVARLIGEMRRLRPEVAFCFQHYGNLIGAGAARLAGVPLVVANQTSATMTTPALARRLDRALGAAGLYDRIVVNSRDAEAEYRDYPQRYRDRVVRIEHGFKDKSRALRKDDARGRFGLPSSGPVLGCVARLHPLKHLDAAVRLLTANPTWRLALAGQGPTERELLELARSLGCADRLHLVGELPSGEVGAFLAALDVFVFPSLAETFGLAAVEAAQAGVPVVANDLDVLREVLAVDGEPCAVFVSAKDPEAFAAGVRRVLDEPSLARELSARGRRLSTRYSLDAMVDGYEALMADAPRATRALR